MTLRNIIRTAAPALGSLLIVTTGCSGKAAPSTAQADEPPPGVQEQRTPNGTPQTARDESSWTLAGTESQGHDTFVRVRYQGSSATTVMRALEVRQARTLLGTIHLGATCNAQVQGMISVSPGAEWIIGPIDFAPGGWRECTSTATQAPSLEDVKLVATRVTE